MPKQLYVVSVYANALDAVICLLAASDFLQGKCIQPDDLELAKKEAWIWVRNPKL